jgi:signal transduction histidine kinase
LEKLDESGEVLNSSSELMICMVQDLLDLAQIRNGKFRKNISRFDIRKAVSDVIKIQAQKAADLGIELIAVFFDLEENVLGKQSPIIESDEQRVKQVLLGLITNALKFTKLGKVEVRVRVENRDLHRFLVIDVADTGVGIPEEDMPKLFQLFGFIENKNSAMNKNGIGLGLTIAKSIVE